MSREKDRRRSSPPKGANRKAPSDRQRSSNRPASQRAGISPEAPLPPVKNRAALGNVDPNKSKNHTRRSARPAQVEPSGNKRQRPNAGTTSKDRKFSPGNPKEPISSESARIQHIEHMRAVDRKRKLYKALLLWVVVLLIMIVAAAAVLFVTDYVAAKPNCSFITTGSIEHTIGVTALIVRDEKTFASTSDGTIVASALEGSRVAKDQKIAMVIPDNLKSITADMSDMQGQIVDRQRELLKQGRGTGAATLYQEADNNILPIINMVRSDSVTGNLANLVSYSSSIQVLMDTRDSALQSVDFQDEQLTTMIAQKTNLENQLSTGAVSFQAELPGIISYKLDGLEDTLTPTSITDMTPDQYKSYVQQSKGTLSSDLSIKAGEKALRICQNAEQFLVTVVAGCSVTDFPTNSTVAVRIPSEGIKLDDLTVQRSIQTSDGVFLVLRTTSQVERLLDLRTVSMEIIRKETPGLRVPAAALLNADYTKGYAEIMYNSSGYARKMTVSVVDHDREYAIIQPVEGFSVPDQSTIIITNPNTISEGEKVEQ